MIAVWAWMRAELRARWIPLLGIALLLGVSGGVAVAAAAGARRTETAYDRFLEAQNAADVTILDDGETGADVDLEAIVALPQVASYARGSLVHYLDRDHAAVASVDDRLGRTINRFKVLSGRMYDSARKEEVVVGFAVARQMGLRVGSTIPLVDDAFDEDLAREGLPNLTLRVVGIIAAPGEFPPQYTGLYPSIHLTPALHRVYGNRLASGAGSPEQGTLFIKLRNGAADVRAFRESLDRVAAGQPILSATAAEFGLATRRSFHFQAAGLWCLAAFAGLATILAGGQALARQSFLGSAEFPVLGALGFGRRQLFAVGVTRASLVGLASAAIAAIVAPALSPLAPVGDARIAEPDPGIFFDATAVGLGAAGLALIVVLLASIPAWRMARADSGTRLGKDALRLRPSRVAGLLARAGAPASGVAGARLAFETGRGRTAVPVRSTVVGAAFGIAVLVAAMAFGQSLDHLVATPSLYGVGWDAFLTHYSDGPDMREAGGALLKASGLRDVTIGGNLPLEVGDRQVLAIGVTRLRGTAGPPIVEGRAPRRADEIALTTKTARRIDARPGQRITVRVPVGGAADTTYTIVGRSVIAPFGFVNADPGEGALLTVDGLLRLIPEEFLGGDTAFVSDAMVRFEPGADRAAVISALAPLFGRTADEFGEGPSETPADIVSFGRVQNLPLALGLILGFVAAVTVAHNIASSVRRRRSDLAILKTLGFGRGQLRATVAWQATVLVLAALALGVPAGIALGRWIWLLLADQISVVPEAVVSGAATLAVVPGAIILANVFAAIPARSAARLQPALVLRTE